MKFWVGLGSRSIPELRVGSGLSLGLKVWVGLGHKLGKILGLLWVKALVTFQFSGWVRSGFFRFFANSNCNSILFTHLNKRIEIVSIEIQHLTESQEYPSKWCHRHLVFPFHQLEYKP